MTEIKRLNYFTSQFLVEKDFKDEQDYHRRMRHLHNRSLHTWGVVEGLEINKFGDKQVSVNNGMAIDSEGKEIVVLDEQPTEIKTVSLSEFAAGSTIYITLAAQDFEDEQDRYTLGSEIKYTRTTERPQLEARSTQPADDGTAIVLAEVTLDDSGNVDRIDNSVRRLASVHIPPGAEFSGPLNIQDALNVGGNVGIGGNLAVSGDLAVTGNVNAPLKVTSDVSIGGNLTVSGNLEVTGDVIARDTEHIEGNVSLGNDDKDEVSINGVLRSTHSSGILQIDDALNVTGPLTVSGGNWDLTTTEGDLKVGSATHRLKIGVAIDGAGAGDVRIFAQGGTNRLMLGSNTADVLTVQNGNVGIGTTTPEANLHVLGKLLGAAQDTSGKSLRICCGKTPEGSTNWQVYHNGIYVDVDTSACGFKSTPIYIVNMHGNNGNWIATGGSSAYNRTNKGFQIYVRYTTDRELSPTTANNSRWHIGWIAIGD